MQRGYRLEINDVNNCIILSKLRANTPSNSQSRKPKKACNQKYSDACVIALWHLHHYILDNHIFKEELKWMNLKIKLLRENSWFVQLWYLHEIWFYKTSHF